METDTGEELETQEVSEAQEDVQEEESLGTAGANLFDSLYAAAEEDGVDLDPEQSQPQQTQQQPTEEEEPKKKVKRIHKKEVIDPEVPELEQPASQQYEAPVEDPFIDELLPEEKQHLEVVRRVANKTGNGEDARLVDFFKKNKDYIEKRLQDEPDIDLSDDPDYQSFVARNRPDISTQDLREAEMDMVAERAEKAAYQKLAPRIAAQEREAAVAKILPQVNAKKEQATAAVSSIIPEDIAKSIQENGAENVQKSMPFEYEIIDTAVTNAATYAQKLIDVTSGVERYDPQNQVHAELSDWIRQEEEVFIQTGQTKDQSGRPFMRRERWLSLPQQQRDKYWTWGEDQLIQIMYARAKESMDQALQQHRDKMSAYGQAPQPQQQTQVQPPAPPPTRVAPRTGGTPAPQANDTTVSPLSLLGM